MNIEDIRIDDIHIGERYRQDLGDIDSLARSIDSLGLLQPIAVTEDNRLIFGRRRIEAFKKLGKESIPVVVLNLDDPLQAEHDENEKHKPFTITERVAIGKAIEEKERQAAKERQREGGKSAGRGRPQEASGIGSGNLPEATQSSIGKDMFMPPQESVHCG
jgi:ParB/RepB/Spo0J family partition protein